MEPKLIEETPMTQATGKKVHKRTKDCEHLIACMDRFDKKPSELSKLFGLSHTTVKGWLDKGNAPMWTHLAVEALNRRAKAEINSSTLFILEIPSSQTDTAKKVLEALGGTITKIERS